MNIVSNAHQYLPSDWRTAGRIAERINRVLLRTGILTGAISGTMREVLAIVVPERISIVIALSSAAIISLRMKRPIEGLSEKAMFITTIALVGGNMAANRKEILGFGEMAICAGMSGIIMATILYKLREGRVAKITNAMASIIPFGISGFSAKIARIVTASLAGYIASYFA